jgi:threonine dehydrogenase-like Zn-dependent dehydrogenase
VARVVDPGTPDSGFAVGDLVVGECSIGCGAHAVLAGVAAEDAVFAEPTAVALRAVLRSGAEPRSRVLVVGGGTLGWLAAAIFLDLLDADVAALEPDSDRMGQLARLGVRPAGSGELFDVVLEASGSPSGVTAALDR